MSASTLSNFSELNLGEHLLRALKDIGYESPSPIQAATIPLLMDNRDVLGQAQTGTGKTAAFALPILARIDARQHLPQALVLAPTRELAIQVAEAFQTYAAHIPGFHVLPIYGGQSYGPQLSALRRGVHVVVGTPGRVIDHLDKGSLDLSQLKTLVLDEADEMLRMGFIDDVERILQETPAQRQTALFSATMPPAIRRIAQTYLKSPEQITVAAKTGTADNIRQRYWLVSGMHKLDALTRILEVENFDGMIIFARTKLGTEELASKLQARGFSALAINGDIQQAQRERTIQQLKDGKIDILVATDVAARGLDVERISHVINYDVPHDPESYTHRIGRTGRAGRSGEAILFITPREKGLLKVIERATRQPVAPLSLPSVEAVNDVRIARFKDQITDTLTAGGLDFLQSILEEYENDHDVPAIEIAAALAKIARGDTPLLLDKAPREARPDPERSAPVARQQGDGRFAARPAERAERPERAERAERPDRSRREPEPGMRTYRIEVGHDHGVKPGNIVGAIANEAQIDSKNIGRIEIFGRYSILDLPADLTKEIMRHLQKVWVAGQQLKLSVEGAEPESQQSADFVAPAAPATQVARAPAAPAAAAAPVTARAAETATDTAEAVKPSKKKDKGGSKAKLAADTYRIEVGRNQGAMPAEIVAVLSEHASLEPRHVGTITLHENHSLVELPAGMPAKIMEQLKAVKLGGKKLNLSLIGPAAAPVERKRDLASAPARKKPGPRK